MATKTSDPLNFYELENHYLALSEFRQSFPLIDIPGMNSLIDALAKAMNEFSVPFVWDPDLEAYMERIRESNKPKGGDKDENQEKEKRSKEITQHKKDFPGEAKKIDDFLKTKHEKNLGHIVQLKFEPLPLSCLPESATREQLEPISLFIQQ